MPSCLTIKVTPSSFTKNNVPTGGKNVSSEKIKNIGIEGIISYVSLDKVALIRIQLKHQMFGCQLLIEDKDTHQLNKEA